MAHQVLARKYRPQLFADVAGQQHVTITLMNAVTQGRIAHGYIFSGHRGIGKTTIARILAMALNCRNEIGSASRPSAEPCQHCESCTEVRSGNAVDVIEIDAATNRGIDEIRELRDAARYRPARDKYKIYILDEAHQITDAAFNALLKTLEEPPEHVIFMMATTQPEDIPQTVRSRCQHFSFHAVKMADILQELRTIADREEVTADETALSLLAEAGDGSMRDALSIMDQAIASAPLDGACLRLDAAQIRELMGTVSNSIFERLMNAVDEGRSAELITVANELLDAGNSPVQLARQFVHYLRNCVMAKITGLSSDAADGSSSELLQTSQDEQRRAARTAAKFSEEELARFLQVMLRTFDELGYRQEQRFHLELGLLKLVHLRRLLPMEEVLSRLPQPTAKAARVELKAPTVSSQGLAAVNPSTRSAAITPPREALRPSASPFERDVQRKDAFHTLSANGNADDVAHYGSALHLEVPATSDHLSHVVVHGGGAPSSSELVDDKASSVDRPSLAAVVDETVITTAQSVPSADDAKEGACNALRSARSQGSAQDAMSDATWTIAGNNLEIQTGLSSTMLPFVVNVEAEKIVRGAVRGAGFTGKVEILPGKPNAQDELKRPARGRSGTAQARAEQHPVVQQAQKLFHAEIRKVIDLTEDK